jgi:tRNA (cmo5U34)-methyltransferase
MAAEKILPKYAGPAINLSSEKMTQAEIRARFNEEVAIAYSQRKPVWLPDYDRSLTLVTKMLEPTFAGKKSVRVLDLGAGTGNLSRRILQAFKNCHVTLVDFSQNMLNEAPIVLAAFLGRYEIKQEDFWEMELLADSYDAVISSFALHHGRGEAVYQRLYKNIFRWLKTPGAFICCDVVDGDTAELAALNMAGWRRYLSGKISPTDIERMFSNYKREDSPISLRKHMSCLSEAGFTKADVLWKRFNFAVYTGIKEPSLFLH